MEEYEEYFQQKRKVHPKLKVEEWVAADE